MGTINVVPVAHHILHDHNQLSFPTFLSISRNNIYLYESSAQINNLLWSLCGCTVSFREEESAQSDFRPCEGATSSSCSAVQLLIRKWFINFCSLNVKHPKHGVKKAYLNAKCITIYNIHTYIHNTLLLALEKVTSLCGRFMREGGEQEKLRKDDDHRLCRNI